MRSNRKALFLRTVITPMSSMRRRADRIPRLTRLWSSFSAVPWSPELDHQLPARACVVRQPSLDVTMANLHLGDAHAEDKGRKFEGIQPQSSGLAREGRR